MLLSMSCCTTLGNSMLAAELQRNSMLRPLHEEGNGNELPSPSSSGWFVSKNSFAFFFWLLWCCVAAQLHKKGDSNCIADFIFSLLLLMV